MAKSYKQLFEETKVMLAKYQDEIVPALREQLEAQPQPQANITEEEIFALRAVAYGCNTNPKLKRGYNAEFVEMSTSKHVSFENALIIVYKLIERLEG